MTETFSVLYPQMLGFFYCEESTERNTGLAKKEKDPHSARRARKERRICRRGPHKKRWVGPVVRWLLFCKRRNFGASDIVLYIASCRYCCAPTELRARIYGADKRKKTSLDFGSRLDCPDREKWAFYFLEKRNHCHCLGNN